MQLANDADLRTTAPPEQKMPAQRTTSTRCLAAPDPRLPLPGTLITREYRGETIQVKIMPAGFEHEGEVYKSLSAVARAVTGTHWNGYHFFGLEKKEASA